MAIYPPDVALAEIRDNIRLGQGWIGSLTSEQLAKDNMRMYAVVRCLEIIS